MSKYVTTNYTNNKKIELVPGSQCFAVTVDDSGVSANSQGKKLVLAGTPVGGNYFADPANKVKAANTPATGDLVSTGANNDITVTNLTKKMLKVQLVDPAGANKTLNVQVVNDTVQVNLATNASSAITSIATDIITLLNTSLLTSDLVFAANKGTDTGEAVVTAVGAVTLDGSAVVYPEGVLLHDADVTYGPVGAAMMIRGVVDISKLSAQPSEFAKRALAGRIIWAQ